jgi:hypothetical protein
MGRIKNVASTWFSSPYSFIRTQQGGEIRSKTGPGQQHNVRYAWWAHCISERTSVLLLDEFQFLLQKNVRHIGREEWLKSITNAKELILGLPIQLASTTNHECNHDRDGSHLLNNHAAWTELNWCTQAGMHGRQSSHHIRWCWVMNLIATQDAGFNFFFLSVFYY